MVLDEPRQALMLQVCRYDGIAWRIEWGGKNHYYFNTRIRFARPGDGCIYLIKESFEIRWTETHFLRRKPDSRNRLKHPVIVSTFRNSCKRYFKRETPFSPWANDSVIVTWLTIRCESQVAMCLQGITYSLKCRMACWSLIKNGNGSEEELSSMAKRRRFAVKDVTWWSSAACGSIAVIRVPGIAEGGQGLWIWDCPKTP